MKKADNFDPSKWLIENKITTQSRLNEVEINFGEYKDLIDFKDLKKFKTQEEWDSFVKDFNSTIESYRDINKKVPSTVLDRFFRDGVFRKKARLDKDQTDTTKKGEYSDWWAKANNELGLDFDDDIYSYIDSYDEPWQGEFANEVSNIEASDYEDFKSQVQQLYNELNPF
jgi:hypothetical protein